MSFTVPAAGLQGVACTSHNGAVVVAGAARVTYEVAVVLTAFGSSPAAAEANLALLDVRPEVVDGVLQLAGTQAAGWSWHEAPSFAFTIQMPAAGAANLTTHNGSVAVQGLTGQLAARTHNGGMQVNVAAAQVALETYNGGMQFTSLLAGPLNGSLKTHNGSISIALAAGASTKLSARTHNGSLRSEGEVPWQRSARNLGTAQFGSGEGQLVVETYNGSVRIR